MSRVMTLSLGRHTAMVYSIDALPPQSKFSLRGAGERARGSGRGEGWVGGTIFFVLELVYSIKSLILGSI